MPTNSPNPRTEHFKTNALAWVALRHFLTAPLLRELSLVLVEKVSGGQWQFQQLFEGDLTIGAHGLESWFLKPQEVSNQTGRYIQNRIRHFIGESDEEISVDSNVQISEDLLSPALLEHAVHLGRADFAAFDQLVDTLYFPPQDSVSRLVEAIRLVSATFKSQLTSV